MEELSAAVRALSDRFTVIESSVSAINDRLDEPIAGRRHVAPIAQPEQAAEPTEPKNPEGFEFGSYSDLQAELRSVREGVSKIKLPQDLVVGDSRAGVGKNDLPRFQVIQRCARFQETVLKVLSTSSATDPVINQLTIVRVVT